METLNGIVSAIVNAGVIIYFLLPFLIIFVLLVTFIFKTIGIVEIAKKHKFGSKALAFFPFLNNIYLAILADEFRKKRGQGEYLKVTFIIFSVLTFLMGLPVIFYCAVWIISIPLILVWVGAVSQYWAYERLVELCPTVAPILVVYLIFYFLSLYEIYKVEKPKHRWLFLALSIIRLDWLMLFICGVSAKKETNTPHNINSFSAEQEETQTIKATYIDEDKKGGF